MKVLLLDTNHPVLKSGLETLGCICHEDYNTPKSDILQKIASYDGVVLRSRFEIDKDFLSCASNLKFIARVGAGLDSIDEVAAANNNVAVIAIVSP